MLTSLFTTTRRARAHARRTGRRTAGAAPSPGWSASVDRVRWRPRDGQGRRRSAHRTRAPGASPPPGSIQSSYSEMPVTSKHEFGVHLAADRGQAVAVHPAAELEAGDMERRRVLLGQRGPAGRPRHECVEAHGSGPATDGRSPPHRQSDPGEEVRDPPDRLAVDLADRVRQIRTRRRGTGSGAGRRRGSRPRSSRRGAARPSSVPCSISAICSISRA